MRSPKGQTYSSVLFTWERHLCLNRSFSSVAVSKESGLSLLWWEKKMYWRRVNGQASSFERLVAESKQVSVFFSQRYGLKFCFAWNLPNFNVCWFPLGFFGLISSTERTDICFEWHIQLAEGMLTLCFDNKTVIFLKFIINIYTLHIYVSKVNIPQM